MSAEGPSSSPVAPSAPSDPGAPPPASEPVWTPPTPAVAPIAAPEHLPPRAPPPRRRPSLVRRAIVGGIEFLIFAVFWLVVPSRLLGDASSLGLQSGVAAGTVALGGLILTTLAIVRYVVRPTAAFGPVSIAASLAAIVYLLVLAPSGHLSIGFMGNGSATLTYATLLRILAIVPVFGLAAGAVTTVEDLKNPGERVAIEFP